LSNQFNPELIKVLVTGANGFVGQSLCKQLLQQDDFVRAAIRDLNKTVSASEKVLISDLDANTDWSLALQDIQVVIHLAARVHVMKETSTDALAEFRKVNVEGTVNLARQAVRAGVTRFIYLSSIKVNGEQTLPGLPYTAEDVPNPIDPYGISKQEAEIALRQLSAESGLDVVIIRPPLIYGSRVKANFYSMIRMLDKNVPLPFASIANKRSLVALDNLNDLIITCIKHSTVVNQTFLVSDGHDLSTPELLKRMAVALGKKVYLLPVPSALLVIVATILGQKAIAQRLCGSLQVDMTKTCEILAWQPPVNIEDALAKAAQWYKNRHSDSDNV
jgi:nucleoside-diphosphate-sugar epimerase